MEASIEPQLPKSQSEGQGWGRITSGTALRMRDWVTGRLRATIARGPPPLGYRLPRIGRSRAPVPIRGSLSGCRPPPRDAWVFGGEHPNCPGK